MLKKGTCKICGRHDVFIQSKEMCSSDYVLVGKFKGNEKKAKEYRKIHPIHGHKVGIPDTPRSQVEPQSKTWLDVQIENAVGRVIELAKQNGVKKCTLEVDVDITITDVRIKQI